MSEELKLSRAEWKEVQQQLKSLGFYFGEVDGLRGPLTNNAIIEFKKSVGFVARPFFGPLTRDALFGNPPVDLTPWIANGRRILGLHEKKDRQKLMDWFGDWIPAWARDPVEISWCGAFVNVCLKQWKPDIEVPANVLGARQWGAFGERCEPQRGAILTFWRISPQSWQGHVGFMVGQDAQSYHVLGGNQSNAVTIAKLAKNRLLQSRWPKGEPQTNNPAYGSLAGSISRNEA